MTTIIARTIKRGKIFGSAVKLRISFQDPKCNFLVLELPKDTRFSISLKSLRDAIEKEETAQRVAIEREEAVQRVIELLADASPQAQIEATELKAKWSITANDIDDKD